MSTVSIPITNQYMFNRVMTEEDICIRFLECVLGKQIDGLEYKNAEQAIEPKINSKGVRLDIFARSNGKVYDIELQVQPRIELSKRYRYYQSAIDTASLEKGCPYSALPESYIIFVCDHDPFGYGLPVYTVERVCEENNAVSITDEAHWLALNCTAYEKTENRKLADLLEYISTGRITLHDDLVTSIAEAVSKANDDREWVDKVFSVSTIDEDLRREALMMRDIARKEGLEEGRAEGVQQYAELVGKLLDEGRESDIRKATEDPAYRNELLSEFGLI